MRIEEDLKLGFKDVLIRPKRSTLKSRSDVELGVSSPLNIPAFNGLVFRSSQPIWIPLVLSQWRSRWRRSIS